MTGKDVDDYIHSHSEIYYNYKEDKIEPMISAKDAWELVIMVMHDIRTDFEETFKVKSNAESGTLSESNRSSEEDA